MNLMKIKICMIGATAVGKTSLVNRYVSSIFSDAYRTTIGVKIETRRIERDDRAIDLVIWDLSGEDEFQNVQASYLRGASGYLLIVDGTRIETVDVASALSTRVSSMLGAVPFVVVLNKADLVAQWQIDGDTRESMRARGWQLTPASAKTGVGVQDAFDALVAEIARGNPWA